MWQMRYVVCVVLTFIMLITVSIKPAIAQSGTESDPVVTSHEPKTRMSEVKKVSGNKPSKTWLWILLGAVVIAGGVAALAGGASNDSGGSPSDTSSTGTSSTGNYDFSW